MKNRYLLGAAALAVTALAAPPTARACGGFFCANAPIDQSGEYILFSIGEDGVRAYIQIQYQGKAEDFAWVVPVMSAPTKVGVGVQQVFTTLMGVTAPQFRIDWKINDGGRCTAVPAATSGPGSAAEGSRGVQVIDQGEVGPYNYVVVSAAEAQKLKDWLDANGFVQPPTAEPALAHYVKQGFVFVAIKLKRGADTGEIQPLVLDMGHPEACVPLVLTRIAAVPDMPIYAMVLGAHRAVPRNWFEVELNLRKIDWFSGGSNYRALVTSAVNEAAGRAFVTEFAATTTRFKGQLWAPGRFDLTRLNGITDPAQFVNAMLQIGLPRDPIIQSLLRKHVPMPEAVKARGVTEQQFYNNLQQYAADLRNQPFDGAAFIKDIDARIVKPLEEAQQMLDRQPYLTRMFTLVSPDEMTRDPLFDFNPDLPPVSNVHVATGTGSCGMDGRITNATLTFENGQTLEISDPVFPFGPRPMTTSPAASEPAARRINLVGPQGPPIEIARNRVKVVDEQLDTVSASLVRDMARAMAPAPSEPGGKTSSSGGGCAFGGGNGAGGLLGVALALLALVVRRAR